MGFVEEIFETIVCSENNEKKKDQQTICSKSYSTGAGAVRGEERISRFSKNR